MRWFLVIAAVALAVTGSASGELVARAPDGLIAVSPRGTPLVGFVRGQQLVVAERTGRAGGGGAGGGGRGAAGGAARAGGRKKAAARAWRGWRLAAFKAGTAGAV